MDQGLPVGFENTANTWQNMPMMAGFYTGLQNQTAQDNIQMLQRAFANEQAFKDQTRPIELQNLQGANELQKAQAAQALANARKIGIGADREQGTLLSDIVAGNSKNQADVVANQGKQLSEKAKMYQSMATLAADPNIPGFQKVKMIMDNLGVEDPTGQIAQGMLANIDKLPQVLAAQAEHQFQSDSATKLRGMQEEGDTKRTGMNNRTAIEVARINADARLQQQAMKTKNAAGSILDAVKAGKLNYEKAAASFHTLAMMADDPNERAQYEKLAGDFEKANLSAKAAGVTGKPDVGELAGIPTQAPVQVFGNGAAPAQPKPQEHSLADVQKMYPGVPPEKLKQAYKEKFGVDLQ